MTVVDKLRFNSESSLFDLERNFGLKSIIENIYQTFDGIKILYHNNILIIDNNTLTALTLLIAESNPKEKDIIVDLVINFLVN